MNGNIEKTKKTEKTEIKKDAASERRLLILGDSVMKGVTYNDTPDGSGRYSVFHEEGFEGLRENGIELVNRSRMGATIAYASGNLRKLLTGCTEGGFDVILEYGGNDCDFNWKQVSENPSGEHLPNTPPEKFRELYKSTIAALREAGARVAVATLPPIDAERYFKRISTGLSEENILSWLGDKSMLYRWQEYYNSLVEQIAAECECPLIDLRTAFLQSHAYKKLISGDGIHPSEAGHMLARSRICSFAENLS